MRPIYFLVGLVSLGLGVVGILLPILPTTPFLLLSIACFSRSSKRFENWLYHTKMYQIYVADFRETGSIAKERKKKIIVSIYILMGHTRVNLGCRRAGVPGVPPWLSHPGCA